MGALWLVVFPGLVWGLPGWALSRWCVPTASWPLRLCLSLSLGCAAESSLAFLLCFVTESPLGFGRVATCALGLTLAGLAGARFLPARGRASLAASPDTADAPGPDRALAAWAVAVALGLTLATPTKAVGATQVLAPCIHESAGQLLDDGTAGGLDLFDPELGVFVRHLTQRDTHDAWGLASILGHQAAGSMAAIGHAFLFLGSGGWTAATFTYLLLITAGALVWLSRAGVSRTGQAVLAAAIAAGCQAVALYMVNENVLALGLLLGASAFAMQPGWRAGLCAGLILGLAAAVRPPTVLLWPALAALPWVYGGLTPWKRGAVILAAAAAAFWPWLELAEAVYENVAYYPPVHRADVPQSFLGLEFRWYPLNLPGEPLLRGPAQALPVLVSLPLLVVRGLGVVVAGLALVGLAFAPRRVAVVWAGAMAPVAGGLLFLVSADYEKLSWVLMAFVALPALVGHGLTGLVGGPLRPSQRLAAGALLGLGLLLPRVLATEVYPVDPRPHPYLPTLASNEAVHRLPVEAQADWLLAAALWPSPTLVPDYAASLLAAARPAPSELPAEGAVMLWRDADEVLQAARVRLSRRDLATEWMDTLGHPCTGRRDLAVVALHLERVGSLNLELTATRQGHEPQVTLSLTTVEAGEGGYLLVGIHDNEQARTGEVLVTLDGQPIRVERWEVHTVGGAPPSRDTSSSGVARLVSSHAFHLEGGRFVRGPGPRRVDLGRCIVSAR